MGSWGGGNLHMRLLAGNQPVINGDGKQTRDYVFVKDVARANLAASQVDYCGPINIGTSIETDVNQLFQHRTLTASALPEVHGPAKPGKRRSVLAWNRAKEVLGWQPEVGLEEGLRRTVDFFRSRQQH
jgi:UDP-glucose 4-epimerase